MGLAAQPNISSGMQLRAAGPKDEDRVLEAIEWLFTAPGQRPVAWEAGRARLALSKTLAARDAVVLLVEDELGEVVGFCTAYLDLESVRSGLRCWIEDLAVHPKQRSQGVGSRLLAAARDWARDRGATHLELATAAERVDAQRFYDREQPSARSVSYTWDL
jgi:GNAT superfamily N-acetyltransferase